MVVAIASHAGLLVALLPPASFRWVPARIDREPDSTLQLRLVPPTIAVASPAPPAPIPRAIARPAAKRQTNAAAAAAVNSVSTTAPADAMKSVTRPDVTPPHAPTTAAGTSASGGLPAAQLPDVTASTPGNLTDGGFAERLRNAQQGQAIHGVPGSDLRRAPGMQMTDPMNQGIGAVLRNTQRLFGVTNKHCIDVEVWQSLSPDELVARHLSPADVQRANEKYGCNRPLGLSF
jgi:hypothetical protein